MAGQQKYSNIFFSILILELFSELRCIIHIVNCTNHKCIYFCFYMYTHKWNYYLDQDTIFPPSRWIPHSSSQLKSSYPHQRQILIWLLFLVQEIYETGTSKYFVVSGFFCLIWCLWDPPTLLYIYQVYHQYTYICISISICIIWIHHIYFSILLDIKVVSNLGLLWIKLL